MPAAKPQGTAQAVEAKQPAPATGARRRLKAAERPGRGGPSTPRTLPKSAASAAMSEPTLPRSEKRRRLFELAATQGGYFTAAQARAAGYSPRSIVYHVRAGHFERIARGFYRLVEFPALPHEDVIAAWVKAGPDRAVLSHDTALALYELAPSRSRQIHLLLPRDHRPRRRPTLPAVRIHTTSRPPAPGEVVRRFSVRVTAPARTIVDAAEAGADPAVIVQAVGRALDTGLVSVDELRAAARQRSRRVRDLIERAVAEAGRATVR